MRPIYQTDPAAGFLFWATLLIWFGAEIRQGRTRRSDAAERDDGSRSVLRATIVGGWLVAVVAARNVPQAALHHGRPVAFAVAMVLIWAGVALRLWAFRTLGGYFTFTVMTSTDQRVVAQGPYRVLRHPGYAGGALAMAGVGLAFGNWVSFAALCLIPLIGTVNRIRVEEAALLAAVGPDYERFATGRKRLVPFVW